VERVDCIIPAAGSSSRMGRAKLLLPFRGGTIIEASVSAALSACPRVFLVVGCGAAGLAALFRTEPRVLPIENPDWQSGMFSSLFRGMRKVETGRFFIALGDMPMIGPEVYIALLQAPPAEVVAPVFRGTRGHPVLLGQRVKDEALRQDPASGSMRKILAGYPVSEVPWEDDTILSDVDTPEDYARRTSS
jgi:molybdenum cofactor cytidylyltransferase